MKRLVVNCKGLNDLRVISNEVALELQEVDMSFIEDIPTETIVFNKDNMELLEKIDDEVLHDYLTASGYIFNKE